MKAKRRDRMIRFFCLVGFLLAIFGLGPVLEWVYQLQNPQTPGEFMTAGGIRVIAAGTWCLLQVYGWFYFYARLYDSLVAPLLRPTEIVFDYEDQLTPVIVEINKKTLEIYEELQRQQRTLIEPPNRENRKP